jgi:hypothetical protein
MSGARGLPPGATMTQVKKRSGELQEFDRAKVEVSIRKAGASPDVVTKVAQRIRLEEGLDTMELRKRVAEELRKENPNLAEAYVSTVRLPVKARTEAAAGRAKVPRKLPRVPHFPGAGKARVFYEGRSTDVLIEPELQVREIWVNQMDLQKLGVAEGTRVAVLVAMPADVTQGAQPPARPTDAPWVPPPSVGSQPEMGQRRP